MRESFSAVDPVDDRDDDDRSAEPDPHLERLAAEPAQRIAAGNATSTIVKRKRRAGNDTVEYRCRVALHEVEERKRKGPNALDFCDSRAW